MTSVILISLVLLIVHGTADGFLSFFIDRCKFTSSDPDDIEYIYSQYYDKEEFFRFNSSVGKFVGFNEFGRFQAAYLNNNSAEMEKRRNEKARYCEYNVPIFYSVVLELYAEPYVVVSPRPPAPGHQPTMTCSVFKFYPKEITVEWQINGEKVTDGVSFTDVLPSGDWYNQIHSDLEYTPGTGDKISCVVHHKSLKEPLKKHYDLSMPESEKNKIAIGASGLVLGLILSLAGFIYYKKKSGGRILVPSS